jgi:hydroxymethylbilane synthase
MILKLGTRRSLLAWAQSSWVAREVEKLNSGIKVELVGIDTQGDKILDKPLSQIEGKEFFTAELDRALLDAKVDFTVHSMKDLSLDRPSKIKLAAIPARELQHDVILFHESVVQRLREGKEIRIGTSSPRRLTLLPSFLKNALPQFSAGQKPVLKFLEIRGNVNTRLSRVHEAEGSDRKLDGVVLAYAGLERLSHDEKAAIELWKLLENTKMMVVPIQENPTAPAQGALAIECHLDNDAVLAALQKLHHNPTQTAVQAERVILQEWGGGCHQKLGANYIHNKYGGKLFIRGEKPNGEFVIETRNLGKVPYSASEFTKVEASDLFNFKKRELSSTEKSALLNASVCFIAHSRVLEFLDEANSSALASKRVWVSGMKSWHKLAAKGVWVEGSVEYKGFDYFQTFKNKTLLRMKEKTAFLTHAESAIDDPQCIPIACYTHQLKALDGEIPKKISQSGHLYWSSGLPFSTVWSMLRTPEKQAEFSKKVHASGAGKTAVAIRAVGIEPVIIDADT